MSQLTIVILISWLAGVAAYAGGVLAWSGGTAESKSKGELVHGAVAIGSGILFELFVRRYKSSDDNEKPI